MALESQRTLRVTGRELRACRARLACDHHCGLHQPTETSGGHGERAGSAASASDASRSGGPSPERGGGRHDGCSAAPLVGSTARSSIATRQAHARPRRRRPNDRSCRNYITDRIIVSIVSLRFDRHPVVRCPRGTLSAAFSSVCSLEWRRLPQLADRDRQTRPAGRFNRGVTFGFGCHDVARSLGFVERDAQGVGIDDPVVRNAECRVAPGFQRLVAIPRGRR